MSRTGNKRYNGLRSNRGGYGLYGVRWRAAAFNLLMMLTAVAVSAAPNDYMVVDLSGGPNAKKYPVRYSAQPPDLKSDICRTKEMWFRLIPAGTFMMGSPDNEPGRDREEELHQVTLTQPFYIGVFEVTQKQYELVTGKNPSKLKGDTRPVESVLFEMLRGATAGAQWPANNDVDADSFFGRLRARMSLVADLPTEAQWEYACRAGTTTALNSGKEVTDRENCPNMAEVGRYASNCGWEGKGQPPTPFDGKGNYHHHTKVGMYLPNAWGLYDMHGNVDEWCLDWYGGKRYGREAVTDPKGPPSGTYHRRRGGAWGNNAFFCRSAVRLGSGSMLGWQGFRAVIHVDRQ